LFKKTGDLGKDSFGFKLFGKTWIIYRNPGRKNTWEKPLHPKRYRLRDVSGHETVHEGSYLPDAQARELRAGRFDRVTIDLA